MSDEKPKTNTVLGYKMENSPVVFYSTLPPSGRRAKLEPWQQRIWNTLFDRFPEIFKSKQERR